MTVLETANVTATGGRAGCAQIDDGKIDLDFSPPGANGPGANPEQLFAAGYAACFGQAVIAHAKAKKIDVDTEKLKIHATVRLNKDGDKLYLDVTLNGEIPGADQSQAETLMKKAHETCPYSCATRGNVEVTLKTGGQALQKAA